MSDLDNNFDADKATASLRNHAEKFLTEKDGDYKEENAFLKEWRELSSKNKGTVCEKLAAGGSGWWTPAISCGKDTIYVDNAGNSNFSSVELKFNDESHSAAVAKRVRGAGEGVRLEIFPFEQKK